MINGDVPGGRFRGCSSSAGPRISPLTAEYGHPRPSLSIIMAFLGADGREFHPVPSSHAVAFRGDRACFEHSDLLEVKDPGRESRVSQRRESRDRLPEVGRGRGGGERRYRSPASPRPSLLDPTTSFSTATTLIYAIGAGITAAAGTRLALRSVLGRTFGSPPFRLRTARGGPHRYLSSLPPRIGIG